MVLLYTLRDRSRSERLSQNPECRLVDIAESATPIQRVPTPVMFYRYFYTPTYTRRGNIHMTTLLSRITTIVNT